MNKNQSMILLKLVFTAFMLIFGQACSALQPATQIEEQPHTSYQVKGKRYHILKNLHHYRERGYASWYSSKFQSRRTSSGERYNKNQLTAAHKTLPLNSVVKVKNLSNGKEVIVRVNDRGPFVKNRIIDLSYLAAKKIGLIRPGHGLVEIHLLNYTRE